MNCDEFVLHLCSYLDGEAEIEILQHVSACRCCRLMAESCQKTIHIYRAQPAPELPAAVHQRVMEHVGRRIPPSGSPTHPKR